MKNKRLLAILAIAAAASMMMSGCGFGGDEPEGSGKFITAFFRNGLIKDAVHELLRSRDPRSADVIHEHNVRRVIRALEMLDEGTSYADQKAAFSAPRPTENTMLSAPPAVRTVAIVTCARHSIFAVILPPAAGRVISSRSPSVSSPVQSAHSPASKKPATCGASTRISGSSDQSTIFAPRSFISRAIPSALFPAVGISSAHSAMRSVSIRTFPI